MATQAQKLKQIEPKKVEVKLGREVYDAPTTLGELVEQGYDIKQQMDALKKQLDNVNKEVVEHVRSGWLDGSGTVHVLVSGIDCSVSLRDQVTIADADKLASVLGPERFEDLVRVKTKHEPERKLVAMATDGDGELQREIADCLQVREAKPSVSYKYAG